MKTYTSRYGGDAQVVQSTYPNGNLAVQLYLVENGETCATLSVDLPAYTYRLLPGEFFAMTYVENTLIALEALEVGVVCDTGARVETSLGLMPIWRCL